VLILKQDTKLPKFLQAVSAFMQVQVYSWQTCVFT